MRGRRGRFDHSAIVYARAMHVTRSPLSRREVLQLLSTAAAAPLAACAMRPTDHRAATSAPVTSASASREPEAPRTLIIAHRGASAYLPEHTLAAYALAYGQGADVIEPDVVLTADGVPICAHDLHAETTTNARDLFASRTRPDGHVYYADLTLAEVRTLSVHGRGDRAVSPEAARAFTVPTLGEMIALVQTLNSRTGRQIGIIPEAKHPAFHAQRGLPLEAELVRILHARGYSSAGCEQGGATIQSFDPDTLVRIRNEHACRLPLVYLCRAEIDHARVTNMAPMLHGIGLSRHSIEPPPAPTPSPAAAPSEAPLDFARRLGLKVFTYTFTNEPENLARYISTHRIDALFTDNPDVARCARDGAVVARRSA